MFGVLAALLVIGALGSLIFYYARTGAPPVPSTRGEIESVLALLGTRALPKGAKIYELGSGFGALAIAIAESFPDAEVIGVELSPIPLWFSRLRSRSLKNLRFERGDFLARPLSDADAVTTYLMIAPMPRVAACFDRELRPGTPAVTIGFWFRDRKPLKTVGQIAALYEWPGH